MFEKDEARNNAIVLTQATIEQLILLLTIPENSPLKALWDYNKFLKCFLVGFQSFMTPHDLLHKLISRFNSLIETPDGYDYTVKASVLLVLREWVRIDYGSDFNGDILHLYDKFSKSNEHSDFGIALAQLGKYLKSITIPKNSKPTPPPIFEPSQKIQTVYDINQLELARQLTLMEAALYVKIKRTEFLQTNWCGPESDKNAANLLALIAHGNRITAWITTEILKCPNSKSRCDSISYFIHILQHLEQLKNFNGIIHVLSSLHSSTIGKLKGAWLLLGKKEKESFDRITQLMSNYYHYRNYNEALSQVDENTPCIPLLSIICSDLFAVGDNIPDQKSPGWINWTKIELMTKKIQEAKRFDKPFVLEPVMEIQNFIKGQEYWTDENISYEIAVLRENYPDQDSLTWTKTEDLWTRAVMTDRDWRVILTGAQLLTFSPGSVILKAGEVNRHLYKVKSGVLNVQKTVEQSTIVVGSIKEGDTFGEISMVLRSEKGTITVDIVAATEVEVYQIDINLVIGLCETEPQTSAAFAMFLAKKLARTLKSIPVERTIPRSSPQHPRTSVETLPKDANDSESSELSNLSATKTPTKPKNQANKAKLAPRYVASPRTISNTPNEAPAEFQRADDIKFYRLFGLEGEVVLRQFSCSLKKKNTLGTLFLSQSYLCFAAVSFGFKIREKILLESIKEISKKEKSITVATEDSSYTFASLRNIEKAYKILHDVWNAKKLSSSGNPAKETNRSLQKKDKDLTKQLKPTPKDWEILLKGSRTVSYKKDEVIMKEDENYRQIYQVSRGVCKIMKNGVEHPLGKIRKKQIFGEISFLEDGKATANVIAGDDGVQVTIIEGYFLNILFQHYPDLSGRFFHYIAGILARRIKKREKQSTYNSKYSEESDDEEELDIDTETDIEDDHHDAAALAKKTNPILQLFQKNKPKNPNASITEDEAQSRADSDITSRAERDDFSSSLGTFYSVSEGERESEGDLLPMERRLQRSSTNIESESSDTEATNLVESIGEIPTVKKKQTKTMSKTENPTDSLLPPVSESSHKDLKRRSLTISNAAAVDVRPSILDRGRTKSLKNALILVKHEAKPEKPGHLNRQPSLPAVLKVPQEGFLKSPKSKSLRESSTNTSPYKSPKRIEFDTKIDEEIPFLPTPDPAEATAANVSKSEPIISDFKQIEKQTDMVDKSSGTRTENSQDMGNNNPNSNPPEVANNANLVSESRENVSTPEDNKGQETTSAGTMEEPTIQRKEEPTVQRKEEPTIQRKEEPQRNEEPTIIHRKEEPTSQKEEHSTNTSEKSLRFSTESYTTATETKSEVDVNSEPETNASGSPGLGKNNTTEGHIHLDISTNDKVGKAKSRDSGLSVKKEHTLHRKSYEEDKGHSTTGKVPATKQKTKKEDGRSPRPRKKSANRSYSQIASLSLSNNPQAKLQQSPTVEKATSGTTVKKHRASLSKKDATPEEKKSKESITTDKITNSRSGHKGGFSSKKSAGTLASLESSDKSKSLKKKSSEKTVKKDMKDKKSKEKLRGSDELH
eukprot:TRINITY_DN15952_c0_g1_i1.p1 TRINITY_DN15952_c0_g1~~TRINITY_DN15952_c0_g1_i1.p1  ORF type:complete len:1775 (-),score=412.71 TRINITY_DN15952_c0_g1_i1:1327-5910(-)